MKEDNFFLGQVEDKVLRCRDKYIVTHTGFLDAHQQSLARLYCRQNFVEIEERGEDENRSLPPVRAVFYGGYEAAERVVMLNLPDYASAEENHPVTVIRAEAAAGGRPLTHRDYLGSLLALGLKRESFGDILVREDGADILMLREVSDFVLLNYVQAGRTTLSLSEHPVGELIVPPVKHTTAVDTVASLRLDSIIASAFGLSRGKAAEAVNHGLVFVNHIQMMKPDFSVSEGDVLTLRGKGKACLREVRGRSRKNRQYVVIDKY